MKSLTIFLNISYCYKNVYKRFHTEEDKQKLSNIKRDIFENKIPTTKLNEKYFRYTDNIASSKFNIAYLTNTCRNVSNELEN